MMLETKRLVLRPWEESDAAECYRYAKDPLVGPIAGWPAHTSIEDSLHAIRTVLSAPGTFAVIWKETGLAIGSIGLKFQDATDLTEQKDECEIGFWLGVPYWGQGIMTEAVKEMLRYAFESCGMKKVWCGRYEGNEKSKRVQEKCGFRYQWTTQDVEVALMKETRVGLVSCITKIEWEKDGF